MEVLARVSRRFAETTLDLGVIDRIAAEIGQVMNAKVDVTIDAPAAAGTVVVPLRAHGRVLGTLTASRAADHHPFTADDQQLLEELADRAAIAIENSRLYRDNLLARSRAEQLYAFAQAAVTAERLEQVFDAALESIQRAVGARRTAILAADSDGAMRFCTWRGLSDAYRRGAEDKSPWPRRVTEPKPVVIRDVSVDPDTQRELALLRSETIGSFACFPIVMSGQLIGKISVYYDQPHEYSAHDLELATAIANHLATVMHRYAIVAKLEDAVRYRELFARIFAHDLRNPLNAISTAAQLLLRRFEHGGEAMTRPIANIIASCDRVSRMIDQLLDFSRARSSDGIEIHPRPSDLADICSRAVTELLRLDGDHEVKLDIHGDCHGVWDPDRLLQIFSSLIGNAIQHCTGGVVTVEVDGTSEDIVSLRVHNTGCIPAAMLPTLFDAFPTVKRPPSGGLGLGLFIVRELVAAHRGTVHVSSSDEQGTTFTLQLPRSA